MKLTPSVIKRIIAEEREKLAKERQTKLFEQLKLLKKLKNRHMKSMLEAKELHEAKKLLLKRIKGAK
tara:strand:+ start:33610 stop:33810 length:201 start_codon:yes stop_codon:yes gene_type:complete